MERKWKLFDTLIESLGGEEVALCLCKALSTDNMNDMLEYIAAAWDIIDESEGV